MRLAPLGFAGDPTIVFCCPPCLLRVVGSPGVWAAILLVTSRWGPPLLSVAFCSGLTFDLVPGFRRCPLLRRFRHRCGLGLLLAPHSFTPLVPSTARSFPGRGFLALVRIVSAFCFGCWSARVLGHSRALFSSCLLLCPLSRRRDYPSYSLCCALFVSPSRLLPVLPVWSCRAPSRSSVQLSRGSFLILLFPHLCLSGDLVSLVLFVFYSSPARVPSSACVCARSGMPPLVVPLFIRAIFALFRLIWLVVRLARSHRPSDTLEWCAPYMALGTL